MTAQTHQEAIDEAARKVLAHLQEHSPEVIDMLKRENVSKDLTTGDVHATTALGNQKGSKKVSFADALEEGKKKKKQPVAVPDGGVAKQDDVDWELPLQILKTAPDQKLVFGWASIATKDGKLVVDKQDDMILPHDLEKAAYDYVLNCRTQGDMHISDGDNGPVPQGRLVASMVFTKEMQEILKIDLGLEGWFVGFKVDSDELWKSLKAGRRPEFSIGGKGRRIEV